MLTHNTPDPNTILFQTLNELIGLASPKISMWPLLGKPDRPVLLRFYFRQSEKFDIYHRWLHETIASFSGHTRWGIYYLPPTEMWNKKLLLAPRMFTDYWAQFGLSSDDNLQNFFGQEEFDRINSEAMKDTITMATYIRSRYNSHPPLSGDPTFL